MYGNILNLMYRVITTDLPKSEAEFVTAVCNLAWGKVSAESNARELLAQRMKDVLDRKYGPSWNVLCGSDMGFALKSRKKNSAILVGPRHTQLVVWRSPGHEIYSREAIKLSVTRSSDEATPLPTTVSKGFKVIQSPKLGDKDYLAGIDAVIPRIDTLISNQSTEKDLQVLAKQVRAELTLECGPIWHVVTGENFSTALASTRASEILVKKGNIKVQCFMHSEMSNSWPSLMDFGKAWKSIGFILVVVLFFVNKRFCQSEQPAAFCPENASDIVTYGAAIFLGLVITKGFMDRRLVSAKTK